MIKKQLFILSFMHLAIFINSILINYVEYEFIRNEHFTVSSFNYLLSHDFSDNQIMVFILFTVPYFFIFRKIYKKYNGIMSKSIIITHLITFNTFLLLVNFFMSSYGFDGIIRLYKPGFYSEFDHRLGIFFYVTAPIYLVMSSLSIYYYRKEKIR